MTTCASCGAETPAGARFCPSCGVALAEAAPPEEMLKLVTVLFADVVSSTARAERMHPEDTRALMTEYFAAMAEEIEAEGGTVEKFIGDAIMAVFGAPTAHEDDALRAVRAARRMLERLRSWNDGRDPAEQLELRIGVNTGEAIAAGTRGRRSARDGGCRERRCPARAGGRARDDPDRRAHGARRPRATSRSGSSSRSR